MRVGAEPPGQDQDQRGARAGCDQSRLPSHAAPRLRSLASTLAPSTPLGTNGVVEATSFDRFPGQIAIREPSTRMGMLHQIQPTIGKIQAFKVAVRSSSDSASSEK